MAHSNWYERLKLAMPLPNATNYPQSKQGPNSVLQDIGNRLTQTEADKINKQHNTLNYVGHGQAGIAFQNGNPNTVVKLTRDALEAERAKEIIGKNINCCVKVFDVQEAGNGVWKLTLERVQPLSDEEIEIFDLCHVEGKQILKNKSLAKYYDMSLVRKCLNEYNQLTKCLRHSGVSDEDAQGSNLGRKANKQLCLLDVG